MKETFVTVFFDKDSDETPQDFPTYAEAKEYAEEKKRGTSNKLRHRRSLLSILIPEGEPYV